MFAAGFEQRSGAVTVICSELSDDVSLVVVCAVVSAPAVV
jgi:hypothetical protein